MMTVSLVEDNNAYRELLSRTIRSFKHTRLLSAYATGEEALTQLAHEQPDVALVDIQLPGIDGIECIRRLRAAVPPLSTHFIILTGYEDDNLIFQALQAGARGYLLKSHTSSAKLLAAIKDVIGGGAPLTPTVARKVITSFENRDAPLTGLSKREEEVLRGLARGLLYEEISNELSMSKSTLRTHLMSIYDKLHVHSRTQAAVHFLQQKHGTDSGDHSTIQ